MPLRSEASSSRDTLNTSTTTTEERRRTGRYVAIGAVLAIMLLTVHHALLRDASTITGVCIPAIIMVCYIVWILYSAHRDRRKALRYATAMQLTEVISVPSESNETICDKSSKKEETRKPDPPKSTTKESRENPTFTKDEAT